MYIVCELLCVIDVCFCIIWLCLGCVIVGLLAGGYGVMVVGLCYMGIFLVIELWLGYFYLIDLMGMKLFDCGF